MEAKTKQTLYQPDYQMPICQFFTKLWKYIPLRKTYAVGHGVETGGTFVGYLWWWFLTFQCVFLLWHACMQANLEAS